MTFEICHGRSVTARKIFTSDFFRNNCLAAVFYIFCLVTQSGGQFLCLVTWGQIFVKIRGSKNLFKKLLILRYAAYGMPHTICPYKSWSNYLNFGLYDKKNSKKKSSRIQNNINTPCTPRKSRLPN